MPQRRHRNAPSLALVTAFFATLGMIIFASLLYATLSERIRSYEVETLRRAVLSRSDGVEVVLARALNEDWSRLNSLASALPRMPKDEIESLLSYVVGEHDRVAWVAYAGLDGQVKASAGRRLDSSDVGTEKWFVNGLLRPTALSNSSTQGEDAPKEGNFVQFAMPVDDAKGSTVGVVTLALSQHWAENYMSEVAHSLDVDLLIVDAEGNFLLDTGLDVRPQANLASVRAAVSGDPGLFLETLEDGKSYFVETHPMTSASSMPPLGLRFATRMPASVVTSAEHSLSNSFIFYLVAYGAMLILVAALFIQAYIRPFSLMARSALKVANGSEVYPYESNRTKELQQIGLAITRLEMKVHHRKDDNR